MSIEDTLARIATALETIAANGGGIEKPQVQTARPNPKAETPKTAAAEPEVEPEAAEPEVETKATKPLDWGTINGEMFALLEDIKKVGGFPAAKARMAKFGADYCGGSVPPSQALVAMDDYRKLWDEIAAERAAHRNG